MPIAGAAHTRLRTHDIGQEASSGVLEGRAASVPRHLVESAVPQSSSFLVYHKYKNRHGLHEIWHKNFYLHNLQKEWCSYKYVIKLCADTSQVDDKVYIYYKSIATRVGDRWSVEGHNLHLA